MTLEEIEDKIQHCLNEGMETRVTKEHIENALYELIPCLAFVGRIEQEAELNYGSALEAGVLASVSAVNGERLRSKFADGYTAKESAYFTRAKRLGKSLDMAISALQTALKSGTNI